jgi:hypothetical protein
LLPNEFRGWFVAWCFRSKLPRLLLQCVLHDGWLQDHGHVCNAAGSFGTLFIWFRDAAFELPADLPDPLPVWRGTSGIAPELAADGISWTTSKVRAAFFACTYRPMGEPLILRRDVQLRDVLMFSDERNEGEVIVFRRGAYFIDGDHEEWRRLADEAELMTRGELT